MQIDVNEAQLQATGRQSGISEASDSWEGSSSGIFKQTEMLRNFSPCWLGDLICKMGVHSYLMKLFREMSKILCIDLGPQNSTEMVYDNITIICRPTWVRRVWFELLVTWLPHVFSLIVLSSWRFLYQMVSSERNFLQPVIKKESEPADWGATCIPASQQDHEDQGKDTDGLASPCRHRFLRQYKP